METQPSQDNVDRCYALAEQCVLCPRLCRVDRLRGERGYCGVGKTPVVASSGPHFGEETVLVGSGGSGTIFLSGCNLLCVFCQNPDISHGMIGREQTPSEMAENMLSLQRRSCENINLVTPSHVVPWLMDAARRARLNGLTVPIVYNCGGYDRLETLRLLEGTVDIYMPDAKFWDPEMAFRYANARNYADVMGAALHEMHRQVGVLQVEDGVATRGLLVRHLVMPGGVDDSKRILDFIATEVSPDTHVNVMPQYRPMYRAEQYPTISRPVSAEEHEEVRRYAGDLGLNLL